MREASQQRNYEVAVVEATKVVSILRLETNMVTEFSVDSIDTLCMCFDFLLKSKFQRCNKSIATK